MELFDFSPFGYVSVRKNTSGMVLEVGAAHFTNITVGAPTATPLTKSTVATTPLLAKKEVVVAPTKTPKPALVLPSLAIRKDPPLPIKPEKVQQKSKKAKPRTEKSLLAESVRKEQSLVARLTRIGLRTGLEVEVDFHSLSAEMQAAIVLPGPLWKEFAIEKSLAGYQEAKENRSLMLAPCIKHTVMKEKLNATLAGRKTGQCLFRRSSHEDKATTEEAATVEEEVGEISWEAEEEEDRQTPDRHSSGTDPAGAFTERFSQETVLEDLPQFELPWNEVARKPYGSGKSIPVSSNKGGHGRGTGCKAGSLRSL